MAADTQKRSAQESVSSVPAATYLALGVVSQSARGHAHVCWAPSAKNPHANAAITSIAERGTKVVQWRLIPATTRRKQRRGMVPKIAHENPSLRQCCYQHHRSIQEIYIGQSALPAANPHANDAANGIAGRGTISAQRRLFPAIRRATNPPPRLLTRATDLNMDP